jgi:putative thioredoxin
MEFMLGQGKPAAGGNPDGSIKDTTAATFMADVIEASRNALVLVDFWATWCGPCKQLGPLLEKLVKASGGKVRLAKVDIDKNQELAAQLRIQSVPTVYAFRDGRPVDAFAGALPESQLKAFIAKNLGAAGGPEESGLEEALAMAKEILEQGDLAGASQIYGQIIQADPENALAFAGLARCHLKAGNLDQADQLLASLPADLAKHADIQAAVASAELARQSQAAQGASAELRKRLAENANDHQARFDLALAYYGAGEREAAVDELLELVRRNRAWNEEAGRKQLVKLFEAFGPTDPLTIETRKRLSSILFS